MNAKASVVCRVVLGVMVSVSLQAMADEAPGLLEARKVASAVPPKLLEVLGAQIAKDGPASAVGVCHEKAPQMARTASEKSGWAIRRVSLRVRNPKALPDPWEQAALEDFDRRAAAGESPVTLEKYVEIDTAGQKEARYMKALPVQQVCLACHGASETIAPEVSERLRTLYPADQATGYTLGQIRGAITLRRVL